jgi:hypothetical protein
MANHELLVMISTAEQELSEAEIELDGVLGAIRTELGAQKIGVTRAVEDAFAKLRRAKGRLAVLRGRISARQG